MHRPTGPHHQAPHPPDPAVLAALLARHGWRRRGGQPGRYSRWTPPGPTAGATSLLLPDDPAFPDSADLLAEAVTALEHSPHPSADAVLHALHTPGDEVHVHREHPEPPAPAAPWAGQDRLRTATRALLLAAALAAHGPAAHHGARHRRRAETALAPVLVTAAPDGQALTAHVPLHAPPDGGRPLVTTLLDALRATRAATDQCRATGSTDGYTTAVTHGGSRELTDAVAALVHGCAAARVTVHWAPAAGPPPGAPARPAPVTFTPDDLPALREAAARYIHQEPALPVTLTGTVVRLRRESPWGPGTVRLRVLSGADVTHVRATLGAEDYRVAGYAHLAGVPLTLTGRLESRGGFRRLAGAHDAVPARTGEADHDHMLKSLRENLDALAGKREHDQGHG
ncbi:hypothetical protein GCM10010218_20950 [Streptomyces mashuensis]|uniref:Uncharacterized protein n=1 Tax=Streptomyces mashuensis TaxID=33904 RepID=A0A919B133_9ACTN|nr:hypothetical protein [Streptomyces mashuensis]GHF39480.1 hypothetical protein GCM10010218_20950 [Streptomyces mashuensis]